MKIDKMNWLRIRAACSQEHRPLRIELWGRPPEWPRKIEVGEVFVDVHLFILVGYHPTRILAVDTGFEGLPPLTEEEQRELKNLENKFFEEIWKAKLRRFLEETNIGKSLGISYNEALKIVP